MVAHLSLFFPPQEHETLQNHPSTTLIYPRHTLLFHTWHEFSKAICGATPSRPYNFRQRQRRLTTKSGGGWQVHREFDAVKEAAASDREVALELEEHLGMVGLGIHLEKGLEVSDQLGMFFLLHDSESLWIVVVGEQHLLSSLPFVHSTAPIDSTDRSCGSKFHLPSYEIHGSFTALMSLVANYPGVQQYVPTRFVCRHQRRLWSYRMSR